MKKFIRYLHAGLLSMAMLLSGCTSNAKDTKKFDEFMDAEAIKVISDNFISFHFGVDDYEKLGIPKAEVKLPTYSYEVFEETKAELQESLDLLHEFDYDTLDDRQQHDYLAYEYYLNDEITTAGFPDFQECYNPYNGSYFNTVTSLTEFAIHNRGYAEDYLTLMEDFPRMIDEMNEFTKEQASKGFFMTDENLDATIQSMQGFIDTKEENPFIVLYNQKVDKLEDMTEEEKTSFKEKNRDLVLNTVFPAIQKAQTVLESLRGSRSVSGSIYEYEDGKEYYEALAKHKCTSTTSLDEKRDYLKKCLTQVLDYSLTHVGNADIQIDAFTTPEEMMKYFSEHMEDFPKGPELRYTMSYLEPCVASPSSIAYFLQPPIDNYVDNIIRINGDNVQGSLNRLYRVLSHEGLPGHMYQFTWYYSQPDTHNIRHVVTPIGYAEGWAQYVPRIMMLRSPLDVAQSEFLATTVFISYTVQSYADILVNGYGYDAEAVYNELVSLGVKDFPKERVDNMYKVVSTAPGQTLPYAYGMCKLWELNERTQASLGDDFNLEEFHLQVLKNGPRTFEMVESDVKKYVESKGVDFVEDFTLFTYSATPENTEVK